MTNNSTASIFAAQWSNPVGFLSLLMIVGGPIIQSALAQVTGPFIVPICFSFGWVTYAFSTITALVGDGRLMPPADYPCKVINLENGYARTNRSWILGRLLRDLERPLSDEALSIAVYEAMDPTHPNSLAGRKSWWIGFAAIVIQLAIAAIPFLLDGDWGISMITAIGTSTALSTAALPQWRVEKQACRYQSKKKVAITTGNGSRHVVVILGNGVALDLEDMAAGEGPRQGRPWIKSRWFVKHTNQNGERVKIDITTAFKDFMKAGGYYTNPPRFLIGTWMRIKYFQWYQNRKGVPQASKKEVIDFYAKQNHLKEEARLFRCLPLAFWMTRICCGIFIVLWAVVLLSVLALKDNAWYLIGVGTIGMVQNAVVAAANRKPETRGIYLRQNPMVFIGGKVMDVLMDLETWEPGCGKALLKEFFPAGLDVPKNRGENDWWNDLDKSRYDDNRYLPENKGTRYDSEEQEKNGAPSRGRKGGIRRI